MAKTERELVLDILTEVLENGKFSHKVIGPMLEKQPLSRQEKAFITRLSQGTMERLITMDYIINLYSKTKVNKMKPVVRNVLRFSVYQMFYMEQISDATACNEAVKIMIKRGMGGLKGFVNGVLRTIAREKENIAYPDMEKDFVKASSVIYSVPEWLVKHFNDSYDKEKTIAILRGFSGERPMTVRVNLQNATLEAVEQSLAEEGIVASRHPHVDNALFLEKVGAIHKTKAFREGWIQVQDASSILAVASAGIENGMCVLDVCAAPGGKSMFAADLTGTQGSVIARDLTEKKVDLIRESKERCKFAHLHPQVFDATQLDESMVAWADVVLADLPCSGLGILSKKPDIKYRVQKEDLNELVELQKKILDVVWQYVKPGGVLLYSTCTINPQENEGMVQWFLTQGYPFTLESMQQLFPGEYETDGFFMAKLRRK